MDLLLVLPFILPQGYISLTNYAIQGTLFTLGTPAKYHINDIGTSGSTSYFTLTYYK